MAELTPLDEKLGEVLGLAQAAQGAADKVGTMEDADDFAADLKRMRQEAEETERRTDELVGRIDGKKTAIREMAAETKSDATEMMKTYLAGEDEALDGFEFLSMAEAGELCHWEIIETMASKLAIADVRELASLAVGVQKGHVETVRRAALALAKEEASG